MNLRYSKSQGEIFGIALLFVVIIIGLIVYTQFAAMGDLNDVDEQKEREYKILAESSLNTLLKSSTGCEVERDKESIRDLINYCLENEYAGNPVYLDCESGVDVEACSKVIDSLNESLFLIFNNSNKGIADIPFELRMDTPANANTKFANKNITNFNHLYHDGVSINETTRRSLDYKRAPSGIVSWSTAQREINVELYLYYR